MLHVLMIFLPQGCSRLSSAWEFVDLCFFIYNLLQEIKPDIRVFEKKKKNWFVSFRTDKELGLIE